MSLNHEEINKRANLVFEMVEASHGLTHWIYDAQGNCLQTNSSISALDKFLSENTGKTAMLEYGQKNDTPITLSLPIGLVWIAVFERQDDKLYRVYVLGPAFHTEISIRGITNTVDQSNIPLNWKRSFMNILYQLPVLSITSLRRTAVMLHYAVTSQKITSLDVSTINADAPLKPAVPKTGEKDRHRTYMAEQKLLDNVRNGNMQYQSALAEAGSLSSGIRIKTDTSLEQVRTTQIVFISLCVRAAIEGGLSPEMAYSTGDAYIQQVNDSQDINSLGAIGHTMYQDFIQMVHKQKQRPDISKPIQSCLDYILSHLEEPLTSEILSQRIGYSINYLAKRFSEEMGLSPSEYIQKARIERACLLLTTTTDSIPEISQQLLFCNRGYFSTVFKKQIGMTPAEYRKINQVR